MPSTSLKSRYFVCDNAACVHYQLLRRVDPIDLGEDLFTVRPVFCACRDVELRRVDFDPDFEIPEGLSMHLIPLQNTDPPMANLKVPAQTAAAVVAGMDVGDSFYLGDYHVTIIGKQTASDQDPPRFTIVHDDGDTPVVSA